MKTKEILIAARALIANPIHWTQGAIARDAAGNEVMAHALQACRFCALGAAVVATPLTEDNRSAAWDALDVAARTMYGTLTAVVNDERGHADVLAVYDRAIADCED